MRGDKLRFMPFTQSNKRVEATFNSRTNVGTLIIQAREREKREKRTSYFFLTGLLLILAISGLILSF